MIEYSIVIPAYNEADKITSTLTNVLGFMREYSSNFEVLVVNDGSTDNTVYLAQDYAKLNPEIKVLNEQHRGKGPTVTSGVMASEGSYIYLCDADLATPISELKKLALWIKEHDYDIVIASREGTGAVRVNEPFYRHLMGRVFNLVVQIAALPGIKDSQCGFKLFKHDVAKEIFGMLKIYGAAAEVRTKPYLGAFDVEVLYLAKKLGYKVKSLPVTWNYVKTTRLNVVSDSINMARDVLKVRINDAKGVYK